jgi:hypothetical protein
MARSNSSAGDLAQVVLNKLAVLYGQDSVRWIDGEDDTIGVEDENDVLLVVKVEMV